LRFFFWISVRVDGVLLLLLDDAPSDDESDEVVEGEVSRESDPTASLSGVLLSPLLSFSAEPSGGFSDSALAFLVPPIGLLASS
jgi:hypothetical protein